MNNGPDYDNLFFEEKKMTQKIFDTDNADDMALLWSILPEIITKLTQIDRFLYTPGNGIFTSGIIKIDFHDKTEIVRPIHEATFDDVGKLCIFWEEKEINSFGILEEITSLMRLKKHKTHSIFVFRKRR